MSNTITSSFTNAGGVFETEAGTPIILYDTINSDGASISSSSTYFIERIFK